MTAISSAFGMPSCANISLNSSEPPRIQTPAQTAARIRTVSKSTRNAVRRVRLMNRAFIVGSMRSQGSWAIQRSRNDHSVAREQIDVLVEVLLFEDVLVVELE